MPVRTKSTTRVRRDQAQRPEHLLEPIPDHPDGHSYAIGLAQSSRDVIADGSLGRNAVRAALVDLIEMEGNCGAMELIRTVLERSAIEAGISREEFGSAVEDAYRGFEASGEIPGDILAPRGREAALETRRAAYGEGWDEEGGDDE